MTELLPVWLKVSANWITIQGLNPVELTDLIWAAPEPPFNFHNRADLDYLRNCAANLLFLDERFPNAVWRDPDNKLFEAKAYRFLDRIRQAEPSEYELSWPFKTVCDPWQIKVFTHGRLMTEIALAPAALGSGKTKMMIDIAADKFMRNEIDGVIVIAPNGVHRQWVTKGIPVHMTDSVRYRAHVWGPTRKIPKNWPFQAYEPQRVMRIMTFNVEAFSTTSGKAWKALKPILESGRFMLIMDESTRIKNFRATRTAVINYKIAPLAKVRAILTGTPITKGYEDFFAQYYFLNDNIIGLSSWPAFRNTYCVTVPAYRGAALGAQKIVGYKNQQQLFRKLAPVTFMIGNEVLGLGAPLRERYEVTLTPEQEEVYEMMAERLVEDLMQKRIKSPANTLVELLRLQQVLSGVVHEVDWNPETEEETVTPRRIPSNRIKAYTDKAADHDGQIVTWCRFKDDIDDLAAAMDARDKTLVNEGKRPRGYVIYDGRVKSVKVREELVERFSKGDVMDFLGNPAAGGTGVDGLQELCSTAFYYSHSFSREHRWQSEGRIYRRGQKHIGRVAFLDFCVPGTVDEMFLDAYERTEELAKAVFDSPAMLLARFKEARKS